MARFSGEIGYMGLVETAPGVYEERYTEIHYYGDLIRASRQLAVGENLNDNVRVSNRISVVADPFALANFFDIRYVRWLGQRWKVSDVEIEHPRLILTLGGLFNG